MRFLVSRLSSLGDVVCTLPAASALQKGHPGCEVVWLVDRRFAAVVDRCQAVNHMVEMPKKLSEVKKVVQDLGEFDAALDMQGLLKSALPVGWAKAKQKIGYHWQREGAAFFSRAVRPDPTSIHIVDQYVDVARSIGGVGDRAEFQLTAKPEDEQSVRQKLEAKGWCGQPIVAVNAGAGWASKRWESTKIAHVCNLLEAEGAAPVFLGAAADSAAYQEAAGLMKSPPISLVGDTNIGELIGLISLSAMHLGGDTGSTHIAAALGRPAFGTYMMTRPERSCPYGQRHRCESLDENEVALAMIAELNRC